MSFDRSIFGAPGSHAEEVVPDEAGGDDSELAIVRGTVIGPTRLWCGQCNNDYFVGDEVPDERLLNACEGCAL
jgi:hypothetical protein